MKLVFAVMTILHSSVATIAAAQTYSPTNRILLGVPDRWDYVTFDGQTDRVYVAHGDRLEVIDARDEVLVGEVQGITGGAHGTAIFEAAGQGFTDDGRNGKAVAFDLKTLKVTKEIPAEFDADALVVDSASGHLFVVDADSAALTVIDAKKAAPIATIRAGEKLEFAVADGHGAIYVAGTQNGDMLKIDARSNRITGRWATPGCTSPHGIAVDSTGHRAFMGCSNNVMMVVDTSSGRTVAKLAIGGGSDAVAFDPVRRRVFSSNGSDGTISAYQQVSGDKYVELAPIRTVEGARTMAVDPATGRLFVAAADNEPSANPGGRPQVKPGTLRLLVFKPNS